MDKIRRAFARASSGLRLRQLAGLIALSVLAFSLTAASALAARPASGAGAPPLFTIEKLQRIAGSADPGFKTEALQGEVGETVEYEIVVADTSGASLQFTELSDPNCSNTAPAGVTELQPGEHETFTCEQKLAATGEWSNQAEIEAASERRASNMVTVEVPERPGLTVEKLQKIAGSGAAFTESEVTGKVGQTVEYEIVVADTGNTPLKFSPLQDFWCENLSPTGATELQLGEHETFTCEHTLTRPGEVWFNEVTVDSDKRSEDSNFVVATAVEEPEFTIQKLQRIQGSDAASSTGELTAKVGQTVDYEIVVSNAGPTTLVFSPLEDPNCTGISPSERTELEPGGKETFTCEHVLGAVGMWTNVATIEGTVARIVEPEVARRASAAVAEGEGARKKESSNAVVASVPVEARSEPEQHQTTANHPEPGPQQLVKAVCTVSGSAFTLRGANGSERNPFTVRVPSLGVEQITFYLDGRKIKTLTAAQARKGEFRIKIDPRKLRYGAHRVGFKTVMSEPACPAVARSAVFVHARAKVVEPKFTG